MSITSHRIDSYKIRVFGNDDAGNEWRWASKVIELYSDQIHVGTAYFAKTDRKAGESGFGLNQISFLAPDYQYQSVIDLLRNEFPVFLCWAPKTDSSEPNDGDAYFETARETAGEGDKILPRKSTGGPIRT